MTAIYIILGGVLGVTVLLVLCLIAGLLVTLLYQLAPIIQQIDIDLMAPLWVTRWRAVALPEQPPVDVVLCRNPVADAEYFHTTAHGLPMFTKHKVHAMKFSLADRLALEAYFRKYGDENSVFVVYAKERQ
jgi:hypothetical protein